MVLAVAALQHPRLLMPHRLRDDDGAQHFEHFTAVQRDTKQDFCRKADIWSALIVFWEMATGVQPNWQQEEISDLLETLPSDYSPAIRDILARMFKRKQEERPTAEELLALIDEHVDRPITGELHVL